jgi:general secretion pathway protein I
MSRQAPETGFTLLETLVALAIIAIAAAGILGAVQGHVDRVRGLEMRSAARWVAENRLAELALSPKDTRGSSVEMLGHQWQVTVTMGGSADPDLRLAEVAVAPAGDKPLVRLQGFVDVGTITR